MKLLKGLLLASGLLGAGPALAHSYSGDVRVIVPLPGVQLAYDAGPAYHGHGHRGRHERRVHREARRVHRRHHRHEHCESGHGRDAHHRRRHSR